MPNTDTRIAALEYAVTFLLAQSYLGLSVEQVAAVRQAKRQQLEERVLADSDDPATSDHPSAELVDAVDKLLVEAARIHRELPETRSR